MTARFSSSYVIAGWVVRCMNTCETASLSLAERLHYWFPSLWRFEAPQIPPSNLAIPRQSYT